MNLTVIIAPEFEPVSLQECYDHLRLDPSGSPLEHPDDDMLLGMIKAATKHCEGVTHRAFVRQKLRLSVGCFPASDGGVRLLKPPLVRVDSISYYDEANALQTVSSAYWYVTDGDPCEVRFIDAFAAPGVYRRPDAVRVEYWAGYPANGSPADTQEELTANVPWDIKAAIKLMIGDLYELRDGHIVGTIHEVNPTVAALLAPYMVRVIA